MRPGLWRWGVFAVLALAAVEATAEGLRPTLGYADDAVHRVQAVALSSDGRFLLLGFASKRPPALWNLELGTVRYLSLGRSIHHVEDVAFSPDSQQLVFGGGEHVDVDHGFGELHPIAVGSGSRLTLWKEQGGPANLAGGFVTATAFSGDGRHVLLGRENGTIQVYDSTSGEEVDDFGDIGSAVTQIATLPGTPTIVVSRANGTLVLRPRLGAEGRVVSRDAAIVALAPGARYAFVATRSGAQRGGYEVLPLAGALPALPSGEVGRRITAAAVAPDGRWVAIALDDGSLRLLDLETGAHAGWADSHGGAASKLVVSADGRLLARVGAEGSVILYRFETGERLVEIADFGGIWLAHDGDGRFDSNRLEELDAAHWTLPGMPELSIDTFLRQRYQPELVQRRLAGAPLPPLAPIEEVDLAVPLVSITGIDPIPDRPDAVRVRVRASAASDSTGAGPPRYGEIHDLRLLRDGQLVGYRDGRLEHPPGSPLDLTFDVRLPGGGGQRTFWAYAFGRGGVRSATARQAYRPATGIPAAPRTAYIVSVGVNAYESADLELSFAVNDARAMQQTLTGLLGDANVYDKVVGVQLVSAGGPSTATRSHLRAAIDALAGRSIEDPPTPLPERFGELARARPGDLVVITFSGHGYLDTAGEFYFLTSDTGTSAVFAEALEHAVTSADLSKWLRDVDASDIALVIDACHAAGSIGADEFKPAPLGNKGLGQLAYDKGMMILAASQADDVALELEALQMGLLTYALTHEAMQRGAGGRPLADYQPSDGFVELGEWLAWGAERAPTLLRELREGKRPLATRVIAAGGSKQRKLIPLNAREPRAVVQQPSAFNTDRDPCRAVALWSTSGSTLPPACNRAPQAPWLMQF